MENKVPWYTSLFSLNPTVCTMVYHKSHLILKESVKWSPSDIVLSSDSYFCECYKLNSKHMYLLLNFHQPVT